MEAYQEAAEKMRRSGEYPINLLQNLALTAAGGGVAKLGSQAASKLIPGITALLNAHVPDNLSQKGLSKVDPRFGKFIQGALDAGHTYDEVRQFIGNKIQQQEQPPEAPKQNRNIIEQHSPELHQFILEQIQNGRSPLEAAALASLESTGKKGFKKIIDRITKEHKAPWSAIIETVYGGQQQQAQQPQNAPNQQQQAPGQGQQALMSILEKINQRLGQ